MYKRKVIVEKLRSFNPAYRQAGAEDAEKNPAGADK
jgi:hypothetical protein